MLYLLPEEYKKKVLREYRMRLLTVSFACLAAVAMIALVTILPSYFLVQIRSGILQVESASIQSTLSLINADDISKKVSELSNKTSFLIPIAESISPSKLFAHLDQIAKPDTVISDFNMTYFDDNVAMDIRGVSKNRESLTKFVDDLRADPAFSGVNFPYNSLSKQANLDFTIHLLFNRTASSSVEFQ
jgi:hypothetical protein